MKILTFLLLAILVVLSAHASMEQDFLFSLEELALANPNDAAQYARVSNMSITEKSLEKNYSILRGFNVA